MSVQKMFMILLFMTFRKITTISLLLLFNIALAQDSLTTQILKNHTIYFKIKDDRSLDTTGANFFKKETKNNQFIILGEYHNSRLISNLTEAIIPIFKMNGGNYLGLEIGPASIEVLQGLNNEQGDLIRSLNKFNTKYKYTKSFGTMTAIPFMSNVSDAEFLEKAFDNNLKLIGLDQEFKYALIPLLEKAFNNLPKDEKEKVESQYLSAIDTLQSYYAKEVQNSFLEKDERENVIDLFHNSKFLNNILNNVSSTEENERIVEGIEKTINIYWNNSQNNYWQSNKLRTENFVANFRNGLKKSNFDYSDDKMLIKIGGIHSAKGMNNYSMYDIGNTIFEIAKFNGNSAINSVFLSRFQMDNDTIIDALNANSWYSNSFKDFIQMGKKDEWAIIDLRPLKKALYYKRDYLVNDRVREYFDRYDLIIITPMEINPIPNYELSN